MKPNLKPYIFSRSFPPSLYTAHPSSLYFILTHHSLCATDAAPRCHGQCIFAFTLVALTCSPRTIMPHEPRGYTPQNFKTRKTWTRQYCSRLLTQTWLLRQLFTSSIAFGNSPHYISFLLHFSSVLLALWDFLTCLSRHLPRLLVYVNNPSQFIALLALYIGRFIWGTSSLHLVFSTVFLPAVYTWILRRWFVFNAWKWFRTPRAVRLSLHKMILIHLPYLKSWRYPC